MKVKVKAIKIMVVIVAIMLVNISISDSMSVVNAAGSYDSNKALEYAESQWNTDKSQLCAEFVSNCLKAGGISAWSKSCTALRSQLINSGTGKEYEIKLQSNQTIKASDYNGNIAKGDVVFFYCSGCVKINGKPYIHAVLCNGLDSNGYMKAYSHNNANSGKTKYQYSSKCSICGTKISKAYVYHFNSGFGISFDKGSCNLSVNNQENISVKFSGNGVSKLAYDSSNEAICGAEWGNVDKTKGTANLKIIPRSVGQATITVLLLDENNNSLYQKGIEITIDAEKGNINFSKESMTLNLSDNKTGTVDLTWDYKTGAKILQDYDKEIVAVTHENMTSNSVTLKFEALKAGTTSDKVTIVDASGNKMGTAVISLIVEEQQPQESNTFEISFESEKYDVSVNQQKNVSIKFSGNGINKLAYDSSNEAICGAEWGNVDWTTGTANLNIIPRSVGQATITVLLLDENNNSLYQKGIEIMIDAEKGNINFSKESITLNLSDNKTGTVDLTWDYKTGAKILQDYDKEIIAVTHENMTSNSVTLKFEALKAGTTSDEVTIVDASGNKMGTAKILITVEDTMNEGEEIFEEPVKENMTNTEEIEESANSESQINTEVEEVSPEESDIAEENSGNKWYDSKISRYLNNFYKYTNESGAKEWIANKIKKYR